jgi:hypothetical protein
MSDPVKLSVRSSLSKIIAEMDEIRKKSDAVSESLKNMGNEVDSEFNKNVKKTETFLGNLRKLGGRVADQLRGDFKSLIAINAIQDSLKLSNQFKGSIAETVALSDTIRKLGGTFNIAGADFSRFQSKLVKGLGDIGLSSEVASRTMKGLAETPVRGENNILGYSQSSGMLASVSREQGQEDAIARGMAKVIQARGGDVNDLGQVNTLAESLRRVFNQTGKGPTETLRSMEQLFANMPKDLRKSITSSGLSNLAVAGAVGGPNATKFLEEYLGKSPIARMAFDAQGGKGVFGDKGIDIEKFSNFASGIMGRVGGDPRLAAQTLGLSEDAAEGFVRLAENLDKVREAQDRVNKSTGDLNTQYKGSMGLGEAFRANINRVKSSLGDPLSWLTQKGTDLLSSASQSDLGSTAVVAGGGALAALLAGMGTRGLGKGLMGTLGKGAAATALTGKDVQPVYVVNASEIGSGGLGVSGGGGGLGTVAKVAGAAALAYGGGSLIANNINGGKGTVTPGAELEWMDKNMGEGVGDAYIQLANLAANMNNMLFGTQFQPAQRQQKVIVETNDRGLKTSTQPTRGSSF